MDELPFPQASPQESRPTDRALAPDPAAAPPGQTDTGHAQMGLRVLFYATALFMAIGLLGGALSTYQVDLHMHRHGDDSGSLSGAWINVASVVLRVASFGLDAALLYALYMLSRAAQRSRGLFQGAIAATAIGVLAGILYTAAPMFVHRTLGTAGSVLFTVTAVICEVLVLIGVLRLTRREVDAPAGVYLVLVAMHHLATWFAYGLLSQIYGDYAWLVFVMRSTLSLAHQGILLWLIARAQREIPQVDAGQGAPPAVAGDAYDLGLRKVVFGALWFLGGLGVTIASYSAAAASPTGGRYMVAYGAVIYGAAQIIRGLTMMGRSR